MDFGEGQTRLPRVYVYELPHMLPGGNVLRWTVGSRFGQPGCEQFESGSRHEHTCLFGKHISVMAPTNGQHVALSPTATFAASRIFHARMRAYPRRVYTPAEADLFYVPIYREPLTVVQSYFDRCPNASQILSLLPHLNNLTAGRHLMVIGRTGILGQPGRVTNRGYDVCPALQDFGKPSEWSSGDGYAKGLLARMVKVATEDTHCCRGHWGHWATWSTPCSNVASGLDSRQWGRLKAATDPNLPRAQLLMGTLGVHGVHARLRAAWKAQCIEHAACDYVSYKTLEDKNNTNFGHEMIDPNANASWPRLWSSMLNATFCMQPMGDSPTRKSTADSLLLGCIPILSSSLQTKVWTWHVGWGWANFSLMHTAEHGLIERLLALPADEVARLRHGVALAAASMAYGPVNATSVGDAVDTVLGGVLRAVERAR